MSETLNVQTEKEEVQLDAENISPQPDYVSLDDQNVKKVLFNKGIRGMSGKKKIIWLLIILLIAASSGYGLYKWMGTSQKSDYLTSIVAKGRLTDSIESTGTLEAVRSSDMGFKSDNTITAINVNPGDHVKEGQILAEQDPTTLQSALQQAQSSMEQDQINIKSLTLTYEQNRKTLDRQQQLFDSGALSQSDLETAQNDYKNSDYNLATAKSKLVNDQAKVNEAQSDLEGATLVAPFDGIIGAVNGQVGQINGINSSTSTLLTIMSEDLQLSALVNEADISRIKVSQDVEFTTSSYTDKTFTGKVVRITPQAETVSNVQYYPVLISVSDPDNVLLAGMSVSANIIVSQKKDILTVPMMAVSYAQSYIKSHPTAASGTGTANNAGASDSSSTVKEGSKSVVLVLQNGQPVVKTITIGLNDGSNYEVSEGLSAGEKVIIGSNTVDETSSSSSSSSSKSSSSSNKNQGMGGGMGGPPPGM